MMKYNQGNKESQKKAIIPKNMFMEEQINNRSKGITLIALVITIIVLLILAGITISAITGENGLINSVGVAKEETEIANEREIVEKATVQAMGNNKYGNLEESELQEQLDKETGEGKTEATDIGDEFEIVFVESNRYYTVDKDGNVTQVQEIIKDNSPGDITVGINGEELDGTEDNPYEIWCIEDLVAFSNMVNGSGIKLENGEPVEITSVNYFNGKYVSLKVNLNFKSKLSYQDSERTDFGDINGDESDGNTLMNEMTTGTGFTPIGLSGSFNGTFNGENYQISNIYINYENDTELNGYGFGRGVGLFGAGSTSYTTIKNLEISGEIIGAGHTGGIIGQYAKSIENCINHANVTGYNMVGGIIGYTCLNISSCQNDGNINITGSAYAYAGIGGIIGCVNDVTKVNIKSCQNYGKVGTENCTVYTGGIIGCINVVSEIYNCSNYGEIVANSAAGGIAGLYRAGEDVILYNNNNFGNVQGSNAGGIIGSCNLPSYTSIGNCYIGNSYNIGIIKGTSSTGGIVGSIGGYAYEDMEIYIYNCYTSGEVSGGTVGGVVGTIRNNGWGQKAQYLYVNQVYYLSSIAKSGIGSGSTDDGEITSIENINSIEFVNILNTYTGEDGQYPSEWNSWKLGDEGYPVFE